MKQKKLFKASIVFLLVLINIVRENLVKFIFLHLHTWASSKILAPRN